ncbi:MAG TPA: hypothetical protein VFO41_06585 [Alphaproteobacteria bacterium]|nr:hypothetical protein [Alphaproteobacteria bacterium]
MDLVTSASADLGRRNRVRRTLGVNALAGMALIFAGLAAIDGQPLDLPRQRSAARP